jgi:hypothetical protein
MSNLPPHLEYCDELASYMERASCAVSVLGDLLADAPEETFNGSGTGQSLGFLLQILSDGMMQRSMNGYDFIRRNSVAAPENNAIQTIGEKPV